MGIAWLCHASPKSGTFTMPSQPPMYVVIPFYVFVIILVINLSCMMLATQEAPPDPFSAYASLLSGLIDTNMVCRDVSNMGERTAIQECSTYLEDGPFLKVSVVMGHGVYWVNFTVRNHAFMVGDLARLWGIPDLLISGRMAILAWPGQGVSAWTALPRSGRFDYFLAPSMISIRHVHAIQPAGAREEHRRPF